MNSRMSVIPKLFYHWWELPTARSHRLLDQYFGMSMSRPQLFGPSTFLDDEIFRPNNNLRSWNKLIREAEKGYSIMKSDKEKFNVSLDVQHFKPDEIVVKVVDNYVVVEGKHEEQEDEHGFISRQFVRKYMIPEKCDYEKTTSSLSSDGVLTVTIPKKSEAIENNNVKPIEIEETGKPALENENKREKEETKV